MRGISIGLMMIATLGIVSLFLATIPWTEMYEEEWTYLGKIGESDNGLFIDENNELKLLPLQILHPLDNLTEGNKIKIANLEMKENDSKLLFGVGFLAILFSIVLFFAENWTIREFRR